MRNRILAGLLSVAMIFGSIPANVYGAEEAEVSMEAAAFPELQAEIAPEPAEPVSISEEPPAEVLVEPEAPSEVQIETPAESIEVPAETPEAPPTEPAETPAEPTETPAEPTETPAEPTETPAEPTETPAEPTETPAEPTETPAEPTEVPAEPIEIPAELPTDITETPTPTPELSVTPTPTPEPEKDPNGEYISNLTVYSSADGAAVQELVRRPEFDGEFGGKVYETEYSSVSNSSGFYVSADIGPDAPENAVLTMSGYTEAGDRIEKEIPTDCFSSAGRILLSRSFFSSGAGGGRQAVCTITAGNAESFQTYKILIKRSLDLAYIGCYGTEDTDLAKNLLDKPYDRTIRDYGVLAAENVESLNLVVRPFSQIWYNLKVNGEPLNSSEPLSIPLTEEVTDLTLSMAEEGTYSDPEYAGKSYVSTGEYHIRIQKLAGALADFAVEPSEAAVALYDSRGERVASSLENPNHFKVMEGESYTYNISAYGYVSQNGSFTAQKENSIQAKLEKIDSEQEEITDNDWENYRNNAQNNGVTEIETPGNKEETVQKWASQLGGDWGTSATPPLILGGSLYTGAGKFVYKLDKETGEVLEVSEELAGSLDFALNCLTYGAGMLFVQIGNGQIQALSAKTLKSLWISEPVGGQTLSPVTYRDGYIYTGNWNSETTAGSYICLSVTDEDTTRGDEIKRCTWKYSHRGGFYWAGAYASEKYVVFGSDDGSGEGDYTDTSILYSVSARTGILIDKITGLKGDIRTTVVYENGYIYFATKGGYLYRVRMGEDGSFGEIASYNLGGMATASPVIYKGRIYVGVCGPGGQFNPDGGHHFDVLQETGEGISLAYSVSIPGYPQAGALLSKAYEGVDFNGDGAPDGRVYVYFTYNAFPGGIYMIQDEPGKKEGTAEPVFEPDIPQQQFGVSTICADKDGTLYYKNDSGYLMAITSNSAYLKKLEAFADAGKIKWNKAFRSGLLNYRLTVESGAKSVHLSMSTAEGKTIFVNGQPCTGEWDVMLDAEQKAQVEIRVADEKAARNYTLEIGRAGSNADLSNLIVSTSNIYSAKDGYLNIAPAFSPEITSYQADEDTGNHSFLNLFVTAADSTAEIKAEAVKGIKKINTYEASAGSGGNKRIAVYFQDGEANAVAELKVTAGDKQNTKVYRLNLRRTDIYPPVLTEVKGVRLNEKQGEVIFTSNEAGTYYYAATKPGEKPVLEMESAGWQLAEGENRIPISIPEGEGLDVYVTAKDPYGNKMENPVKSSFAPYRRLEAVIETVPAEACVTVLDENGTQILPKDGRYSLIEGNRYKVTVSCEGYHTRTETIRAEWGTEKYRFELESSRSGNADLKALYVSSSSKYGSGILKLSPMFSSESTKYSVTYGAEKSSLNVWAEAADKKASIKVYALGGLDAAHVNKDETLTEKKDRDGHSYWQVYFETGKLEARVRISVTAEDKTIKNTFLTMKLTDNAAPVLKKVSASRISTERASVVFKTSEKGTYYYKVTEAGKKTPSDLTTGKGIDILGGTTIISIEGLTKGEKDVHIAVKDSAGNMSNTLIIRIPDMKRIQGQGIGGIGSGGNSSSPLGGKNPPKLTVKKGQGSAAEVKKASGAQITHEKQSSTDKDKKNKDKTKDSQKETAEEKISILDKALEEGEISGSSTDGSVSGTEKKEKAVAEAAENPKLSEIWSQWGDTEKLVLLGGILGLCYLLFWLRAKRYQNKKVLKLSRLNA